MHFVYFILNITFQGALMLCDDDGFLPQQNLNFEKLLLRHFLFLLLSLYQPEAKNVIK